MELNKKYKKELNRLRGDKLGEKLENLVWNIKTHFHLGWGVEKESADNYEKLLKEDEVREIFKDMGKTKEYEAALEQLDRILYSDARTDPRCRKMSLITK
jgi:hypothetical protein